MEYIKVFLHSFMLGATNPIFIIVMILTIIVLIFGKKIIGKAGEHWTKESLSKLPKYKYIILNDIFIEVNGRTHQIDHILVSPYGIFSIETKQYNGYITGNKYDKKWIKYAGKKKYYYENPIRQNYGHVKALTELLNIDESKVFNVVCIPSTARLKIEHDGELTRYDTLVERITSHSEVIIDNVTDIVETINRNNIVDKSKRKEHIRNIRENIIDNDLTKCPRCGGQLVERNGQYGKFIGCSNYPKCKYTEKMYK